MSKPWPSNLEIKSKSPLKEKSRWVELTDWLKNFDEMVPLKSLSARREPLRLLELKSSHWRFLKLKEAIVCKERTNNATLTKIDADYMTSHVVAFHSLP
ncbi:hypothetical protein Goari_010951 [Gossypium aridum]|uniref:Uncharacterized protein n=1 Tax=Gossypium aridum TaxID=34290 RepID=A0A7J8WW55_GOSAI|nr:hypothetical protein [Gossypium aridum]